MKISSLARIYIKKFIFSSAFLLILTKGPNSQHLQSKNYQNYLMKMTYYYDN